MRVVAARFPGPRAASAVLDRLQRQLRREPDEIAIAPLGTPGKAATDDTVLAGHFTEDEVKKVVEFVRAAGGEIVANVDERWIRPWGSGTAPEPQGGGSSGGGLNA